MLGDNKEISTTSESESKSCQSDISISIFKLGQNLSSDVRKKQPGQEVK